MTSTPSGAPLRRNQELAIERWLEQPQLSLGLEMGLGKTRSVLEALRLLVEVRHALVVAPKRVVGEWLAENQRWGCLPPASLRALTFDDLNLKRVNGALDFRDIKATRQHLRGLIDAHRLILVSWDALFWLAAALGPKPCFDCVVFDEASYAKSKHSNRFQAARRLAAGAKFRVCLDGTPGANGWEDVWAPSYLLDGGALLGRTLTAFREQYMRPIHGPGGRVIKWAEPSARQEAELKAKLPELWLMMRAKDWAGMPDLIVNDVYVDMPPEAQSLADALGDAALATLPSGAKSLPANVAAGLSKAAQVCNGAVYDADRKVERVHDLKLEALDDILRSTDRGVLLFYQFIHDRDRLVERLGNRCCRIDERAAWEAGECKVLIAHPQEAAVGLNLQKAGHTVVWFGVTYNAWLYKQGNARVHRVGNESPTVVIHRILARHWVETSMLAALEGKCDLIETIMQLKRERDQ
jgi:SNF2 family DNA or RNA helicase